MSKNVYDVGDLVRCTATFATSGTNVDPSAVTFKKKTPSGTTTTLTYATDAALVKSAVGIYYVDVSATEAGDWSYRFAATGTGQSAEEHQFRVQPSLF